MGHLSGQHSLRELNLRGAGVGPEGLAHLSSLDQLEELNASLTMNDAGASYDGAYGAKSSKPQKVGSSESRAPW